MNHVRQSPWCTYINEKIDQLHAFPLVDTKVIPYESSPSCSSDSRSSSSLACRSMSEKCFRNSSRSGLDISSSVADASSIARSISEHDTFTLDLPKTEAESRAQGSAMQTVDQRPQADTMVSDSIQAAELAVVPGNGARRIMMHHNDSRIRFGPSVDMIEVPPAYTSAK